MICIGQLPDGTLCTAAATKTGLCKRCEPKSVAVQKAREAKKAAEKLVKDEQSAEIDRQELQRMITECHTVEDLRLLELKVLQNIISDQIDPRAGSSIVQILKHQEELIDRKNEGSGETKPHERERAIELAKAMSAVDALALIGDFAHGIKRLMKAAKTEPAIITITAENKEHA